MDGAAVPTLEILRKQSVQNYAPGNNPYPGKQSVPHGLTQTHLILKNVPNTNFGSGCPGDSGSPLLLGGTDTMVAVQSFAYAVGRDGQLCGRAAAGGVRVDTTQVQGWLAPFLG